MANEEGRTPAGPSLAKARSVSSLFSESSRSRRFPSALVGSMTSNGPGFARNHSLMFPGVRCFMSLSRNASNLRQSSSASTRMGSSLSRMPSANDRRSSRAQANTKFSSSEAVMVAWGKSSENKENAGNGSNGVCREINVHRSPSPDPRRSSCRMERDHSSDSICFRHGRALRMARALRRVRPMVERRGSGQI